MRKTFDLRPEGKHPDRVLEAVKHELRKYMKRERRRDLPEGFAFWDFDCKLGANKDSAEVVHPNALTAQLDALVAGGAVQAYVELLAKPATRQRWADSSDDEPSESTDGETPESLDTDIDSAD